MSVKLAKNGAWLAQFRCRDKFGNEVHKCKRGFASAEEAQAWEDEFIDTAGGTMEMTFGDFFKVYEADLRPRLREHTWRHLLERCAVGEYDQPVAARQGDAQITRDSLQVRIALAHGVVELQLLDAASPFLFADLCPLVADSASGYGARTPLHLDSEHALRAEDQHVDLGRAPAAKRYVDVAVRLRDGDAGNGGEGKVFLAFSSGFFCPRHLESLRI